GFSACGSSRGTGVPSSDPGRMRYVVCGSNSHASALDTFALHSRKGVTSSKTQNDLPNVAITRSSPCTTRSRTEVVGKLNCIGAQLSPSSNETNTLFSVH